MLKNAVTVYQVSARQGQMAGAGDNWRELCPKEAESRGTEKTGRAQQGWVGYMRTSWHRGDIVLYIQLNHNPKEFQSLTTLGRDGVTKM